MRSTQDDKAGSPAFRGAVGQSQRSGLDVGQLPGRGQPQKR